MDVMLISKKTLRIKGKNASFVVNPDSLVGKTEADAIVLLVNHSDQKFPKITGSRITIKGPGEYEISGIKISITKVDQSLVARAEVDGIKLLVGSGESIEKIHDNTPECDVAIICSDLDFNQAVLTSLEPRALVIYGDKKESVAKMLGKDGAQKASKYSTTLEKLPQELEVVLLE